MPAIIGVLLCLLALGAVAPDAGWATHDPQHEQGPPGWHEDEGEAYDDPGFEPAPEADPPEEPEWGGDGGDDDGWGDQQQPEVPLVTTPTVPGTVAMLRTNGKAAIPRGAPKRVRAIIAAANQIVGKPYKWGGGHARLVDRGYDCSGTVSYALIRAGLLTAPLVSGGFKRYGAAGAGRWVTIYANNGHVYMEVAGLRLDTSAIADPRGGKGPRWRPAIGQRQRFKVRRPAGL